ncbi:MAG: hypothetical protein JXP34_15745 [Planctomycetes bacterium]|nr:hypothetical protein [Planctomycetota bacterium]
MSTRRLIASIVLWAISTGCHKTLVVMDESGKPVSGALVIMEWRGICSPLSEVRWGAAVTNAEGEAIIAKACSRLSVLKAGFNPRHVSFGVPDDDRDGNVMRPRVRIAKLSPGPVRLLEYEGEIGRDEPPVPLTAQFLRGAHDHYRGGLPYGDFCNAFEEYLKWVQLFVSDRARRLIAEKGWQFKG